ncbi:MAG: carboxymuconolactone decarboxylase family protein [Caldilineaceae bacterium]|nr:carboxymuconolactone decarboxylase family protein [Caldilineaceae bacterium]
MSEHLPNAYQSFQEQYPDVFDAYNQLGSAVHSQGPLAEKTRDLVKLGIAIGIGSEGAVHSHTRKALASGATPEEIRQVVLLSLPTIGFPKMMAALTWVEDILRA